MGYLIFSAIGVPGGSLGGGPGGSGQHPYRHLCVYACTDLLIVFVVRFWAHSWSIVDNCLFILQQVYNILSRIVFISFDLELLIDF